MADAIELKNGAYLRGLILEVDPASHLTLKLPTGEVRKIPIGDVVTAERSGRMIRLPSAPAPAGTVPTPETPSPEAVKPATSAPESVPSGQSGEATREIDRLLARIPGPRVTISVTSNQDAYLQRQIGSGTEGDLVAYHLVCRAPCSMKLPALDPVHYRVDGRRTQATEWFQLPRHDARVKADLVSDMWPLWPKAMLVGSVIFGATGGIMLGAHAAADGADWVRDTGFVFAGVGAGLLLTSGAIWLFKPETSVEFEPAR